MKNSKAYRMLAISRRWLCCSFLFFASCGYRWQPEYPLGVLPKIWIPLISGDEDGGLTSEIIRALDASGLAKVDHQTGDYRLHVEMAQGELKTIGYRRDIEFIQDKPTKNLIASEARKSIVLEVTLFQGNSEKIAYGPYSISAEVDFDYVIGDALKDLAFSTPDNPLVIVLPFSLGQLESNESAQEAATKPLYARLARKIVDTIFSEW